MVCACDDEGGGLHSKEGDGNEREEIEGKDQQVDSTRADLREKGGAVGIGTILHSIFFNFELYVIQLSVANKVICILN